MIYQLQGTIEDISQDFLVIDVHGVGYGVNVPSRVIGRIPDIGGDIKLFTLTIVSQDDIKLCGFTSQLDRHFFKMLLRIPRIGPKGALKILSSAPAVNIMQVILSGDLKKLAKMPGIGPKVAQRLVLELKEKVSAVLEKEGEEPQDSYEETIDLLVDLGCTPIEARSVLDQIRKEEGAGELTFDDLLSRAMKLMAEKEMCG